MDDEKGEHEDPQVLVPRKEPLRELPGRLVGRVAQDQPERDLDGQQQEGQRSRWLGRRATGAAGPGSPRWPGRSGPWRRRSRRPIDAEQDQERRGRSGASAAVRVRRFGRWSVIGSPGGTGPPRGDWDAYPPRHGSRRRFQAGASAPPDEGRRASAGEPAGRAFGENTSASTEQRGLDEHDRGARGDVQVEAQVQPDDGRDDRDADGQRPAPRTGRRAAGPSPPA